MRVWVLPGTAHTMTKTPKNDRNWGGRRDGSGAKPRDESAGKRVPKSFKLHPDIIAFLKTTTNMTATIEEALMRSKAFREWKARRDNK